MSGRGLPGPVEALLLPAIGVGATIAMTMPLDPGRVTPPDLVYCLMIAWVVRRPDRVPLWAAPLLGLVADILLMRPIGLGALGLMLATEAFRRWALPLQMRPFVFTWIASIVGYAAMLFGMWLVLGATFVEGPSLARLGGSVLATAIAYPLVVFGLVWCLGIKARGGSA